jgi:hypothetical protein
MRSARRSAPIRGALAARSSTMVARIWSISRANEGASFQPMNRSSRPSSLIRWARVLTKLSSPAPAAKASCSFLAKLPSVDACSTSMVAKRSTPNPTRASRVISIMVRAMSSTPPLIWAEAIDPARAPWRDHGGPQGHRARPRRGGALLGQPCSRPFASSTTGFVARARDHGRRQAAERCPLKLPRRTQPAREMLRPGETSVNPNLSPAAGVSRAGELTRLRTGFSRTDCEPAPPFASPSRRSRAQSRRMRARAPLQSQRMRARKALRSRAGAPMIASHYT